jgi:hypothetical protein
VSNIGFWSGVGKVVSAPFKAPFWIAKKVSGYEEQNPIYAITTFKNTDALEHYYFENTMDKLPDGRTIIWDKDATKKQKDQILKKLTQVV